MKYLNRGLCHNSDGLFQIDPVRKTFELILSNQIITENGLLMEDVCYDNGKVIAIKVRGNERTLVSVEPSTGKVVSLGVTLPKEHSKFTCARGIVFYARDYTIKAVDGSDGHELFDIDLSDFAKWLVLGCNDKGIVSLAKLKLKSTGNFSTHAEIDLGRMMPDTYEIEKFESAHISLDCLFFRKNELHLRGNKVIYRNSTSNPQRPYNLTYGLIKKNGVSKGKSLMPDISRLSSSIIKVSDDRYVLITNGSVTEEPQISSESEGQDMHKDEERDDQTRPLMRLMSPATGRMVRLNKNHNSEGMMYGCNGYDIRDSVAVSLKGGSFLAVEFSNDTDTIVSTRDVSTGKEYPEGGEAVCGKILDSDEDTILVGLMNKGDRLSRITKAVRYDHHMIPIPGTEMNIPVQLWRGVKPWRFCSDSERIRLVDYSFDGLPLKRIGIPGEPQTFYSDFTEADTYLPAIIPVRVLETFKKVSAPCPMNSSQWLSDTVWYKTQVVICTIHRGILIDEVPTELLIPSDKEDAPMDGILNTINNYIFMDFVDNGYLLTEQYRDDNLPTDLWPYHSFLIGYDGKRTEIASDIIGPTDGRWKESRAVSMLYGKIGYVHRIGNVCEHVLFGSDHTIYVPGNNPFSVYRDENLSVTYQETDGGALIITDGSTTETLPMPRPIQITNMRRDRNGDLHLFFWGKSYREELFIPKGILGAKVCLPKTSPRSKTTYLGRYRMYSCHGLYGIIDDGRDS